jgi:hypothetical protein
VVVSAVVSTMADTLCLIDVLSPFSTELMLTTMEAILAISKVKTTKLILSLILKQKIFSLIYIKVATNLRL